MNANTLGNVILYWIGLISLLFSASRFSYGRAEEGGRYTIPNGLDEYMMVCRTSEKVWGREERLGGK